MRVRRLATEDLGLVLDLDAQIFPGEDPPDIGTHTAWWTAYDASGRPVAYAGAMLWTPDRAIYLHRAGVLPCARGKNIQRRLISVREQWGRRQGAVWSYTYTAHHNVASANNLIASGYRLWIPTTWAGSDDPTRPRGATAWLYWIRRL